VSVPVSVLEVSVESELSEVVVEVAPVLPVFLAAALAATEPAGMVSGGFSSVALLVCTSLLPQPETATDRAISAIAAGARNLENKIDCASAGIGRGRLGGWDSAVTVRTVVDVLLKELLAGAAADPEVLGGPGQLGSGRTDGQNLAYNDEVCAGLAVHVAVAVFDGGDDVALVTS
jgi:hypothetical protein